MDRAGLDKAAETLARRRVDGELIDALGEEGVMDEESAYLVQRSLHARLATQSGFGPIEAYKIGCTTPVMQRYLGIDHPCAGGIFAGTIAHGEGEFPASRHGRLGVECEIAVELGADLSPERAPYDRDQVADAVTACMVAMEIVEDRYTDFREVGVGTLIADDFFNAGCVLGEHVHAWQDLHLDSLQGRLWVNGELRGSGRGSDILGHPLEALAWIANRFSELGVSLPGGAPVLLGSVVQTQWLRAGDRVRVEVEGLGEARARVRR